MWAKSIEGRKPLVSWVFLLWEIYYEWDECDNQQRDRWNVCLDVEEEKQKNCGGWKMKFRERTDREVDNGEKAKGGQAERKRQKKEREVGRWPGLHSLGWMPRRSVQVLRFSPIYIKAPGTQVQTPNWVKRSSDAEKEKSGQLGLGKNSLRKHTPQDGLVGLDQTTSQSNFCSKIEICKSNQNEYEGPVDFDWGLRCDVC